MKTSESVKEIAAALAAAQAEMGRVIKDKTAKVQTKIGGGYSFDYADLPSMLDVVKPALAKHNIALVQAAEVPDGVLRLDTRLLHSSGEWIESSLSMKPDDTSPQKIGSAITYARRYALGCMVGVAAEDEDDDGNAAQGNMAQVTQRPRQQPASTPPAEPAAKAPPPFVAALWNRVKSEFGEEAREQFAAASLKALGEGHPKSGEWTQEQATKVEKALFDLTY